MHRQKHIPEPLIEDTNYKSLLVLFLLAFSRVQTFRVACCSLLGAASAASLTSRFKDFRANCFARFGETKWTFKKWFILYNLFVSLNSTIVLNQNYVFDNNSNKTLTVQWTANVLNYYDNTTPEHCSGVLHNTVQVLCSESHEVAT